MSGPLEPAAYNAQAPIHEDEQDRCARIIMTSIAISFKRLADSMEKYTDQVIKVTREGGMG